VAFDSPPGLYTASKKAAAIVPSAGHPSHHEFEGDSLKRTFEEV
jgi:hypothetical protein